MNLKLLRSHSKWTQTELQTNNFKFKPSNSVFLSLVPFFRKMFSPLVLKNLTWIIALEVNSRVFSIWSFCYECKPITLYDLWTSSLEGGKCMWRKFSHFHYGLEVWMGSSLLQVHLQQEFMCLAKRIFDNAVNNNRGIFPKDHWTNQPFFGHFPTYT